MRKRWMLALLLLCLSLLLGGCAGGQEIESCLFVLSMAVDPAQDGNLTVTVKALSGTQEAGGGKSRRRFCRRCSARWDSRSIFLLFGQKNAKNAQNPHVFA